MGLLGAATVPLLRDSALRTLFDRLDDLRIPFRHRKAEQCVVLTDVDTRILCRPVENFDRLRGTNLAFFGIDELTYCPEAAWLQLEARLRDPFATEKAGLASFTPRGYDWVYRKFIKDPRDAYAAVLATPYENTHLDVDFYTGLLSSYSHNFGRQEVLGEFLNVFSGRAYDGFDSAESGNIWRRSGANYTRFLPCVYDPGRPILWSCDWNITPATSVIGQTVPISPKPPATHFTPVPHLVDTRIGGDNKQLNILDELYLPDTNTEKHCEAFYEKVRPKLIPGRPMHVIMYGDATGERRQSSSSDSDYTIVQRFFSRHSNEFKFEKRVPSANPLTRDRVNAVNAMCCNFNGVRRMAVHERCKELIRDLEEVSWSLDSSGNLLPVLSTKDKARTHISDALGYLIYQEFPLRVSIGGKVQSLGF